MVLVGLGGVKSPLLLVLWFSVVDMAVVAIAAAVVVVDVVRVVDVAIWLSL